jgi:hypothetical protein
VSRVLVTPKAARASASTVIALVLSGASVNACAAIWGFQDTIDGSVADATSDSVADSVADRRRPQDGSRDAGPEAEPEDAQMDTYEPPDVADAPPPSDAPVEAPCDPTAPETYAFYVSVHDGTDSSSCGRTVETPCKSIGQGIQNARAVGATIVNVANGSYAEQLTFEQGVTVVGGWNEDSFKWARAAPPANAVVVVTAPDTDTKTVVADSVTGPATLCTLTIESKSKADPGETLYGVFATGDTVLTLRDVNVSVSSGGDGKPGKEGKAGDRGASGGCDAGTGAMGSPAVAGRSTAGTFTDAGYEPGNGTTGAMGNAGSAGKGGGLGECLTCVTGCTLVCGQTGSYSSCGGAGVSGCAGSGGDPGTGGGGGGSSVGVFVRGATVQVQGSRLQVGNGGNGGRGGAGGDGGAGGPGVRGNPAPSCDTACVSTGTASWSTGMPEVPEGGTPGEPGGSGSSGGAGGGGAGGYACPIVTVGAPVLTVTGSTHLQGHAGSGANGAPDGGLAGDSGVCSF